MTKTKTDIKNCFFNLKSQYIQKIILRIISKGTERPKTDKNENVFGGTYDNPYERSNKTATTELIRNSNLSIRFKFFNGFIFLL
jgi:predicted transcriptional regulator